MSYLASVIFALTAATSDYLDVINQAATAFVKGDDPYILDGVEPRSTDKASKVPDLSGCTPLVSDSSSKYSVVIDFECGPIDERFAHRTYFSKVEDGLIHIYVNKLPTALGPTQSSIENTDRPSPRRQMSSFIRALREGSDTSVGGLIPLNAEQEEVLNALAQCRWKRPRKSLLKEPTWVSFVTCRSFERGEGRMIEIQFDEKDRAVTVRVIYGGVVSLQRRQADALKNAQYKRCPRTVCAQSASSWAAASSSSPGAAPASSTHSRKPGPPLITSIARRSSSYS